MDSPCPLLRLPRELLLTILESQVSMADVLRLSQTCRLLHQIYQSSWESILDVISRREIESYEQARELVDFQEKREQTSTTSPISRFQRLHSNSVEAALVVKNYGDFVNPGATGGLATGLDEAIVCPIHFSTATRNRTLPLQPYERQRIQHCWYFLKRLSTAAKDVNSNRLADSRLSWIFDSVNRTTPIQEIVLWDLAVYCCEMAPEDLMEKLGVNEFNVAEEDEDGRMYYQRPEWVRTRRMVTDCYLMVKMYREDEYNEMEKRLNGPCEKCLTKDGIGECKKRDEDLPLWAL